MCVDFNERATMPHGRQANPSFFDASNAFISANIALVFCIADFNMQMKSTNQFHTETESVPTYTQNMFDLFAALRHISFHLDFVCRTHFHA